MSLRNNRRVVHFVECARAYVALIDNPKPQKQWAADVLLEVSAAFAAAQRLPNAVLPDGDLLGDEFDLDHDQWARIFASIGRALTEHESYRCFFEVIEPAQLVDPPNSQQESMLGSLNDDLADIYRDLAPGLKAFHARRDEWLPEIIFEWRLLMESHWGHHATNAMRALHELVHGDRWPDDDSIDEYLSSRI